QQVALAQKPYTAEDVSQAEAAVRGAQAAVALAAKPFTSEDAQTAAAGVAQAQAAVDLVQTQIDDATVTAPADGVIAKKLQNAGDMAAPAPPVVVLASTQWGVAVQVAEDAIAQVKQGTTVRMTAAAFPEQPFSGTITAISPVIDPQTRTFTVKVEPTGSTPDVRGGMSTRIDVPAAVHNGVPLVPKTAVVSKDGKSLVFTVDAGQAHAVPVTLGLSDDKSAEIVAGLQLGETIVIAGQDRLQDQDPVQVQES